MALGTPTIPTLRALDMRSLQGSLNAIESRIKAIETALGGTTGQTVSVSELLRNLMAHPDGFVVKTAGALVTRDLATDDIPLLVGLDSQADGFIVKIGTGTDTRILVAGSGSGMTITNGDGVANDPQFTVP